MDALWLAALVLLVGAFGLAAGSGARSEDPRARRRWDSAFELESRRLQRTDATGVLMCRSCGASASERAGRCPRCGSAV